MLYLLKKKPLIENLLKLMMSFDALKFNIFQPFKLYVFNYPRENLRVKCNFFVVLILILRFVQWNVTNKLNFLFLPVTFFPISYLFIFQKGVGRWRDVILEHVFIFLWKIFNANDLKFSLKISYMFSHCSVIWKIKNKKH